MNTYRYDTTNELMARAVQVIPCGIPGHFSPAPCVPYDAYPFFGGEARGSRFWDIDGNEFIDYMCAYGPMILGYAHPKVDEAYLAQLKISNISTLASPKMVELAEFMTDLIPIADWAFFAKNGADTTSYATMIARAATGRKKLLAIKGHYHGTAPWMQSEGHHGVLADDHANMIRVPWNDFEALEQAVAEQGDDIAGFIAQPYDHAAFKDNTLPAPGYWQKVEKLLRKKGIVIIIDDVRCGFRLNMGGSSEHYGFKPDLLCFCKAIGNGYPISSLVGTEALKSAAGRVFHTGSYWYSAAPMAAALANLQECKRIDAPKIMREWATRLNDGLIEVAKSHGYTLNVTGEPQMAYYRITDDESMMLHQDWCGECTRRGAYFSSHHNWFVSTAHDDKDLQRTLEIADEAFKVIEEKYGH